MKVIVIGATGTVGALAVKEMLSAGHTVTAFARKPGALAIADPNLILSPGDVLDQDQVTDAISGQDVVVVTLGSPSLSSTIRSKGTLNVIRAMQRAGVKRLICQSTLGARDSWSNLNFFWKRIMFGGLLRTVFRDHELQEHLVEASGLDWTIVRPSAFADGPATGAYKEGFPATESGLRLRIARSDIAKFLTRQLRETRYVGRSVAISS